MGPKPEMGPFLPVELPHLYETSLLTLVGSDKLPHEMCGDDVFRKIRLKFSNAFTQSRNKKKVSFSFIYFLFLYIQTLYLNNIDKKMGK